MATASCNSLVELTRRQAAAQPDLPLYTFLDRGETPGEVLTASGLEVQARRIAGHLQARAEPGARVAIVLPNRLDFVRAFVGCLFAGAVAVPVMIPRNAGFVPRFLSILRAADTGIVLTNEATLRAIRALAAEHPQIMGLGWVAIESLNEGLWQEPALGRDSLAFLQFTSGSTGEPKGVTVSHGNLLHNLGLLQLGMGSGPHTRIVSWLPFFHDWGLIGGLLQPLYLGVPAAIMDPLDFLVRPLRWLRAISAFGATVSGAPNFAYDLCCRAARRETLGDLDLSRWDTAIVSAEPVRLSTLDAFAAELAGHGFRRSAYYTSYGLAESTLTVTGMDHGAGPRHLTLDRGALERRGTAHERTAATGDSPLVLVGCGKPLGDQEVRIVDPDTRLPCPERQVGEIWVRGPSVAAGYWRDPQTTREIFDARIAGETTGGYLRTGDLGFLSEGELFVTGRSKDLIIVAGRNLYPQDLETTVEGSHPALRAGCGAAFAIDGEGRELLVLAQELEFGAKADLDGVVAAVQKAVALRDGIFADIVVLVRPGSIPKTSSGKVRRKECRDLYLAGKLPELAVWKNPTLGPVPGPPTAAAATAEPLAVDAP